MSSFIIRCPYSFKGDQVQINSQQGHAETKLSILESVLQVSNSLIAHTTHEPWAAVKDGDCQWSGSEESRWYQI